MSVDFRLLGDVEALRDGRPLVLGPARPRAVLAALLWDANTPVSLSDLAARVWGEGIPRQAPSSLHSYFTRLRMALAGDGEIKRDGHGYALRVDRTAVDVHRFRDTLSSARAAGRGEDAVRCYDEALGLWRGEPFLGLDSPWLREVRAALHGERETALLERADALLGLGRHAELLVDLAKRADEQPVNERLTAQLMVALYRSGRRVDALARFERLRAVVADELGVDPGPRLRDLYEAILRQDPALAELPWPPGRIATSRPAPRRARIVPRQLAAGPRWFVGRRCELDTMSARLDPRGEAPLVVVTGPAGVGKTALVLHWAREHADLFPDGQLFVDLRSAAPHRAMRTLLTALDVPAETVPTDPEALIGLYRGVLADRRILLVIDNAATVDQVLQLLPGAPGCSVVVTGRRGLTGLVTGHQAESLALDVLDDGSARDLLAARLGRGRAAAEPAAVDDLVKACGGLPLALTVAAGRAQEHPEFPLAALAAELRDPGSVLDALNSG